MSEHDPLPRSLQATASELVIEWDDGWKQTLSWTRLRENCPCATCVHAATATQVEPSAAAALPILSPEETQPLKATSIRPLGNYAYAIAFSDGHASGIYTLEYLRSLGDAS